ncbi:MAG: CsgG/HfaB family protein [Desulfatitalea sp.]
MGNSVQRVLWMSMAALIALGGLLLACAGSGPPAGDRPVSAAVWDLEDLSSTDHGQAGMGEVLSGQIAARIGESGNYQMVERQHLLTAIEELHLGSSDLADPETRLRLGRIIGAQQMVFGAFQVIGKQLRLDLRRVDVASGKILKTASGTATTSDLNEWLRAADQAATALVMP